MSTKILTVLILFSALMLASLLLPKSQASEQALVAIANFGPHSSLDAAIQGIKDELTHNGFTEFQNVQYEIIDVGFDASLIPQMMMHIKAHHPKVLVVITTPVAQYAKGAIHDIPLIYSVITDPLAAGLIKEKHQPDANMTGSSDKQSISLLLHFAKKILKNPTSVGVLYSTAESNDLALVEMMKKAALSSHLRVVAVPINQTRDIPIAMQKFHHNVDFIYVGASGAIQPALPVIAAEANKMKIPVFNMNEAAVKENQVLASFGVNYYQVGINTGKLVTAVLHGKKILSLPPMYPSSKDYQGFISKKQADFLGLNLPSNLTRTQIVEASDAQR